MDDLKKWIENNGEVRDYYKTDLEELWEGIDRKMNPKGPGRQVWFRWAAAMLLLAAVGWFLVDNRQDQHQDGYSLREVSPEMAETEFYYAQLLGEKMEIIKASGAEIDPRLYEDLEQLDQIYKDLMLDLKDNADNEEVVQAMIENYRIRLQMLQMILDEIQKDDNDERDDTSI